MATLELSAGNNKRAKKLFAVSEINPNDNAVAQLKWADDEHGIGFKEELLETRLSFEARTLDAMDREQWSNALQNCELWRLDEPFALRPVSVGGFLASELLQDYREALRITEAGLVAHPNDAGLLNNKAFALSELGKLSQASEVLRQAATVNKSRYTSVAILATEGHIAYRTGDPITGAASYQRALEAAVALKDRRLVEQALIHWLREQAFAIGLLPSEIRGQILNYFSQEARATKQGKALFQKLLRPVLLEIRTETSVGDPNWREITSTVKGLTE
jgi:tetratricopeptide (TPR) repeat protein